MPIVYNTSDSAAADFQLSKEEGGVNAATSKGPFRNSSAFYQFWKGCVSGITKLYDRDLDVMYGLNKVICWVLTPWVPNIFTEVEF